MNTFFKSLALLMTGVLAAANVAMAKVYVVATDTEYVPFEFTQNGKLTGFDVDLIEAIAKKEGIEVRFQPMSFDGIVPALQSGVVDAGVAGMSITPARERVVDFSKPYLTAGLGIMTLKKNADLNSLQKLANLTVGTQLGTVAVDYMRKNLPSATVRTYANINNVYLDLEVGRIKAVVFDFPSLAYYANLPGSEKVVTAYLTGGDYYGIAFKKGSELREVFNKGLEAIMADGEYQKLVQKWFGNMPTQVLDDLQQH